MRPHIWLVCIKCKIIRRINMSACSFWPGPIVAASQKSALGTKVVTTELRNERGPLQGWSLCSLLKQCRLFYPRCVDRLSCLELERGSIFITGLMTWQGWDLIQSAATIISLLAASFTAEPINSGTGAGGGAGLVLIKDWSCMLILCTRPRDTQGMLIWLMQSGLEY